MSALSDGRLKEIEALAAATYFSPDLDAQRFIDGLCEAIRDLLLDGAAVRAERDRLLSNEGALLKGISDLLANGGPATWDDVLSAAATAQDQLAAAHAALREAATVMQQEAEIIYHQGGQGSSKALMDCAERLVALSTPEGM